MRSWFAAHWTPEDLPNLYLVIQLWGKAHAGKANGSELAQMRLLMDDLAITRKGQQERRWAPPVDATATVPATDGVDVEASPYAHLRLVNG